MSRLKRVAFIAFVAAVVVVAVNTATFSGFKLGQVDSIFAGFGSSRIKKKVGRRKSNQIELGFSHNPSSTTSFVSFTAKMLTISYLTVSFLWLPWSLENLIKAVYSQAEARSDWCLVYYRSFFSSS